MALGVMTAIAAALLAGAGQGRETPAGSRALPPSSPIAVPPSASPPAAPTTRPASSANPMRFQIVRGDGETTIYATGDIVEGTTAALTALIGKEDLGPAVVSFDSTGGLVLESIRLGQDIRRRGFSTDVRRRIWTGAKGPRAMCASACVYAYAGGVARYLDDATGRLGVHQYFARARSTGPDDLKIAQLLSSVIVGHLQEMGVSPALYVAAAMTDSGDMLWLDRKDAGTFDLSNGGVLPARADIRITSEGRPYLLVTQIADRGETRITVSCHDGPMTIAGSASGDAQALRRVRDQALRSYLRLGAERAYPVDGGGGLENDGDRLVATRPLDADAMRRLAKVDALGFGIDDVSGTWVRTIDVRAVREEIAYYLGTCPATPALRTGIASLQR